MIVCRENVDDLVLMDNLANQDHKVNQEREVRRDNLVATASLDVPVLRVSRDREESQVNRERPDYRDLTVPMDSQEPRERGDNLAFLVHKAHQVKTDNGDPMDNQELRENEGHKDRQDDRDKLDNQEIMDNLDNQGSLDHKVNQALQAREEREASLERQD